MRTFLIIAVGACLPGLQLDAGTPDQAAAVRRAYEAGAEAWSIKVRLAKTDAEKLELAKSQPDPVRAARQMWTVIGGDLAKEWTIDPAAWFLRVASSQMELGEDGIRRAIFADEIQQVRDAITANHMRSGKLAPMCMALTASGDTPSLILLRKIESTNPDPEVQGVAALGIAMSAKNMGDDPRVMQERLTMLKKAIINSADVELDGTTVAKLAEDELYIIMNLSKGRVAPDLQGVDAGGRPMKLSDHTGKVVVLLFWNSAGGAGEPIIEMVKSIREDEKFAGKAFEVVGVNSDSKEMLWDLQKNGNITWPNFSDPENVLGKQYRVGVWPLAYVLDGERKIHYVGPMGAFVELTAAAVLEEQ